MRKCTIICIISFCSLSVQNGQAKTIFFPNHDKSLFQLESPKNWSVWQQNDVLTIFPPDTAVFFNCFNLKVSNWEHAMLAIHKLLNEKMPKLENPEPETIDIHDYTFFFYYGSGMNEEGNLNKITLAFFSPDENNFCVFLYFGSPAAIKHYSIAIQKMFLSIH